MATTPIQVTGGSIGYSAPSFSYGQTSQAINGGYTFDLPLATVAAFTNNAMSFAANNSQNAQGFFSGVMAQAQQGLSNAQDQTLQLQNRTLSAMDAWQQRSIGLQKYAIKKKFGSGGCFITTAVCKQKKLSDNCQKLQLLRKFRDEHLKSTEEGKKLVDKYYKNAPKIVAKIDKLSNAAFIYNYLDCNFIDRAVQQISSGDFRGATDTYTAMVIKAAEFASHKLV